MKNFFSLYTSLAATLCALLLFSCTTKIEMLDTLPDEDGSGSLGSSSSSSSESQAPPQFDGNEFIDQRDGNRYKYEIAPNGRVWMSENLNYSRGGTIGWCYEEGDNLLGEAGKDLPGCARPYGRTYTYQIATDKNSPRGICPKGWHIPSISEWGYITGMSSGFYIVSGNFNTNEEYLPLGWKERGKSGFYWTSGANNYFAYFYYDALYNTTTIKLNEDANSKGVTDYFSVRCIMDADFEPSCGTETFNPATQTCSGGEVIN